MTTVITGVNGLPSSPYNGSNLVGIAITSGIPSFFQVTGSNLDKIVSVNWYPENPASLEFKTRQIILVDNTSGTFMIQVTNNFLDTTDRGGRISFRLDDGSTLRFPVKTYGPVSIGPLWLNPYDGINTS